MGFENWKTYTLDELYEFGSGLSKPRNEFGFGESFLTFKEVFHNYFVPEKLPELVNTNKKEQEKCSILRGDVFLTRTSEKLEELGMSSVALRNYPKATFNGFTKRLRLKKEAEGLIIPEYAAFYFRSNRFRDQVTSMATMTTRASLNNSMLAKLEIDLPPIKLQKEIADMLFCLHKKVELNKKIITNLEKLSQTLFKRWFVDFEFLNENGEPYKSSGGEMVESELGMIPEGWKVGTFDDLFDLISGFAFKSKTYKVRGKYKVVTIKNVEESKLNLQSYNMIDELPEKLKEEQKINTNDLLMSLTGNVGRVCLAFGENLLLNQRVAKIRPKNELFWGYIYTLLRNENIKERIIQIAKGSAQQNLSIAELKKIKVILPANIPDKLFSIYNTNHLKIVSLFIENERLFELRETLLPKLLSGEIKLSDEIGVIDNVPIS